MFEFLNSYPDNDAIVLIKKQHDIIRDLFEKFNDAKALPEQKKIAAQAVMELKVHTIAEEEVFYPAIRSHLEKHMMTEADEEHHEGKLLMAEIDQMTGSEDHWWAKVHVLGENMTHHFKEEEDKMFPKARKLDIDFSKVGIQMIARRRVLLKEGAPDEAEDTLIKKSGIADSSAKAAHIKKPKLKSGKIIKFSKPTGTPTKAPGKSTKSTGKTTKATGKSTKAPGKSAKKSADSNKKAVARTGVSKGKKAKKSSNKSSSKKTAKPLKRALSRSKTAKKSKSR